MTGTITLGTTLFSLTPEWRRGADLVSLLERLAADGCGPAIEVVGHQAWRGFPQVSAEDERAFLAAVEQLELVPAALGVYTDLYRRPGPVMSTDEVFDDIQPQLEVAARLGFRAVRATLGMEPDLLRRVAVEAERLGVVLTFEVQGVIAPDNPAVVEVLSLRDETGNPYLGFTMDFSVTTPALPVAFGTALRRLGLSDDEIRIVHQIWAEDAPVGRRIGTALAVVAGHSSEPGLTMLIAGMFGRTGRQRAADWADVLPAVQHAHAKFWDPDVESVRTPHGIWLATLEQAGYSGAVVSEWGGHELLDRADADALDVTRAHVQLLTELAADRRVVTA